jgi:hypothetical protein
VADDHLRVRAPGKHALLNPETGLHESPGIDDRFAPNHPLVKAHRWAFGTDAEIAAEVAEAQAVTSVRIADVEQATAAPGEKRATRRRSE